MRRAISSVLLGTALAGGGGTLALAETNVTVQGFIRQELAPAVTGDRNPYNQGGNPYNNNPQAINTWFGPAIGNRTIDSSDSPINWMATRLETDISAQFTDSLKGFVRVRALYAPQVYDEPVGYSMFKTGYYHGNSATPFEIAGKTGMADLPAAYLDYSEGPLWVRAGNQQIAWGESLFFRVLDVPNGLDLRRHLIFEPVAEEFSDKRVAMPAVRGSFRFGENVEFEAFTQMFNPSILPPANSPYNLIPSQFTVHDDYRASDSYPNFGGRLQMHFGDLSVQLLGVRRKNPDGVFQWTQSGVNRGLPGAGGIGGDVLATTPFEVSSTGVCSAQEWFHYAGLVRLNGVTAVNSAVTGDFASAQSLGATTVSSYTEAAEQLNTFFNLAGGCMRGHIRRSYPLENIFGAGANYTVTAEPGSFLDQLIIRGEVSYTPNKSFTNPSLGAPIVRDEVAASLNFEKYHRFSDDFPATYMVLQYLYKSKSDLFGRYLGGFGGDESKTPTGDHSFHALAFAVQQPFPNLIWRADLSILADLEGGVMVQPALRWKPSADWQVDGYATLFHSAENNRNAIDTVNWASEIGLRFTRLF
ncbi:DUF1302 family protein [Azospirillum sp. RWY-5-1]|uniref:DUF1302 family protein n=1 Tax=Azospirillum oleiclasticum TaxID=2735135 RepID=A0ABX2TFH9_9PROT|nr:DUF1302 family protein [Azospirillum oleiclasticum]NYZ16127.1 DUF1302 family protein [Azospirillum oleiclasticum]NYZ23008.1 DUF1302 family protein [Azospirillum oleiclasticum]